MSIGDGDNSAELKKLCKQTAIIVETHVYHMDGRYATSQFHNQKLHAINCKIITCVCMCLPWPIRMSIAREMWTSASASLAHSSWPINYFCSKSHLFDGCFFFISTSFFNFFASYCSLLLQTIYMVTLQWMSNVSNADKRGIVPFRRLGSDCRSSEQY